MPKAAAGRRLLKCLQLDRSMVTMLYSMVLGFDADNNDLHLLNSSRKTRIEISTNLIDSMLTYNNILA